MTERTKASVECGGKLLCSTSGYWANKLLAAISLLTTDPVCILLMPFNLAFGFAAAMLQYYANNQIVNDKLTPENSDQSYVGYAACIAVGTGALGSLVFGFLTERIGKWGPMILGNLCFLIMSTCFAVISEDTLGTWKAVAPLYAIYGLGRGVWEGVNKVPLRMVELSSSSRVSSAGLF